MKTVIRRATAAARESTRSRSWMVAFWAGSTLHAIHPLEAGLLRRYCGLDRRACQPIESPFVFYSREASKLPPP